MKGPVISFYQPQRLYREVDHHTISHRSHLHAQSANGQNARRQACSEWPVRLAADQSGSCWSRGSCRHHAATSGLAPEPHPSRPLHRRPACRSCQKGPSLGHRTQTAALGIRPLKRNPNSTGQKRTDGPVVPVLMPRHFEPVSGRLAEHVAAPKDDVRANHGRARDRETRVRRRLPPALSRRGLRLASGRTPGFVAMTRSSSCNPSTILDALRWKGKGRDDESPHDGRLQLPGLTVGACLLHRTQGHFAQIKAHASKRGLAKVP